MAIRVHELAKKLNLTVRELTESLRSLGIEKSNNFSSLTNEEEDAVTNSLKRQKKGENGGAGEPKRQDTAGEKRADNADRTDSVQQKNNRQRDSQKNRNGQQQDGQQEKNSRQKDDQQRDRNSQQRDDQQRDRNSQPRDDRQRDRNSRRQDGQQEKNSRQRDDRQRDRNSQQSVDRQNRDGQQQDRQKNGNNQQQDGQKNRNNQQRGGQRNRKKSGGFQDDLQRQQRVSGEQSGQKQQRAPGNQGEQRQQRASGSQGGAQRDDRKQQKPFGQQKRDQQGGRQQRGSADRDGRDRKRISASMSDDSQKRRQDRRNNRNERGDKKNDQKKDWRNSERNSKQQNMSKISRPLHSKAKDQRKEQRKEAARRAEEEAMAIPAGAIVITVPITVKGFSEQLGVSLSQVIMPLMKMGIMANANQNLDEDTVQILADDLGKQVVIGKIEKEEAEEGIENFEDREEDLKPRPPIITVMGHVDHGKTSLLDKIRSTSVTASESGGITQHIGASEITHNGQRIVFLDTPGHEAFTAMRARGAYVTDIAVLVVAADDSVKPQTVEAISHAKAANVPVIVAINKIDKPGANPDKVKQDLSEHGILVEDWGGDVISVPVSAKTGEGLDLLLEMILLQAEILELKANPDRFALGTVIEARLDKQKGAVATLLVQNGTLHAGMSIVAGNCSGRIKAMTNFMGESLKKAGPATAVEVLGLAEVPEAGDSFNAVSSDKTAREIAENRKQKQREQVLQKTSGVTLEDLFSQIEQNNLKELNIIVKADVQGSVGALVTSLEKIKNDEVAVKIVHTGVGAINESDVMLAGTTGAIIIGFNVRPDNAVASKAQLDGVEIRTYRVIYEAIEDIEAAMKGMLSPEYKEEVIGSAEVRNTFRVPNVGTVAGAYVTDGKMERNAGIRLVRDGIVVHEGRISSLKRFKDDAKEIAKGFECGLGIENFNDIKEGDILEAYKMVEVERK